MILVQAVFCFKKIVMMLIILSDTFQKKNKKTSSKHQRNYSTVEKDCLPLILSLQHSEFDLTSSSAPVIVFSDHNALSFINK